MSKQEKEKKRLEDELQKERKITISNNIKRAILVLVVVSVFFYVGFMSRQNSEGNTHIDIPSLVKCLNGKGAVLYTLPTCPHCIDQKKMFGENIKDLIVIDCSLDKLWCNKENISGVPTWLFNDSLRLVGSYPLRLLANETGCNQEVE